MAIVNVPIPLPSYDQNLGRAISSTYDTGKISRATSDVYGGPDKYRSGGFHYNRISLLLFDTGNFLPDNATVTSASLNVYVYTTSSQGGRNLVGEYFAYSGTNSVDWNAANSGNAFSAAVSYFASQPDGWQTLALSNVGSVSTTGETHIRVAISGGAMPANTEDAVVWHSYEYGSLVPYLTINYTVPPAPPTANFTPTASGLTVSFNSTASSAVSPATITGWSWTFGDGGVSTLQNPSHTYASAGPYSVGLTVTDSNGGTNAITQSVTVSAPLPSFRADTDGSHMAVYKTGTSYPPSTDSGVIAFSSNPKYAGKSRQAGNLYVVYNQLIKWDTSSIPDATSISAANLVIIPNSLVNNDSRSLIADFFTWSDASPLAAHTSTDPVTNIAFSKPLSQLTNGVSNTIPLTGFSGISKTGNTYMRLSISGGAPPVDSIDHKNQVPVNSTSFSSPTLEVATTPLTPPVARFTSSVFTQAASFNSSSSSVTAPATIATWIWDFGDSSPTASTPNAVHTYAAGGTYNVTLKITDSNGLESSVAHLVSIPDPIAPTASFTSTVSGGLATFLDGSSDPDGTITSWSWEFGDDGTSSLPSPSHSYADEGVYPVTLFVTDSQGLTSFMTSDVTITTLTPISFRDQRTVVETVNASLTMTAPPGTIENDVMLASIIVNGGTNTTITPPAGWTFIRRTDNGTSVSIATYFRARVGDGLFPSTTLYPDTDLYPITGEPTSYTWNFNTPGQVYVGTIASYSNVNAVDPIDVSAGSATVSSTSGVAPTATATTEETRILRLYGARLGSNTAQTRTSPASYVERWNTDAAGSNYRIISMGDDIAQNPAGATGTATATDTLSVLWASQTIALRGVVSNAIYQIADMNIDSGVERVNAASINRQLAGASLFARQLSAIRRSTIEGDSNTSIRKIANLARVITTSSSISKIIGRVSAGLAAVVSTASSVSSTLSYRRNALVETLATFRRIPAPLFPSDSLFPSEGLYPSDGDGPGISATKRDVRKATLPIAADSLTSRQFSSIKTLSMAIDSVLVATHFPAKLFIVASAYTINRTASATRRAIILTGSTAAKAIAAVYWFIGRWGI